ncbi:MAG: energy transducer TonB [Acidobacteria bacterium]|nr:energy transducer TonB [Acidobacteriota bacterium]
MTKTVFCTATLTLCLAFSATCSAASQQADTATKPSAADSPSTPAPDKDGVYRVRGAVTPPKLIYSVEPKIAKKDRKYFKSGTTLVQITVDAEGQVKNAHVIKSSLETMKSKNNDAAAIIDQSSLDAVNQYRFTPSKLDGKPVPVIVNIEINFRLF